MDEYEIKQEAIEKAYDYLERNQIEKSEITYTEWREIIREQEEKLRGDWDK